MSVWDFMTKLSTKKDVLWNQQCLNNSKAVYWSLGNTGYKECFFLTFVKWRKKVLTYTVDNNAPSIPMLVTTSEILKAMFFY